MRAYGFIGRIWKRFGTLFVIVFITWCTLSMMQYLLASEICTAHSLRNSSSCGAGYLIWTLLLFLIAIAATHKKRVENFDNQSPVLLLLGSIAWVAAGIVIEVVLIAIFQTLHQRWLR